MFELWALQEIWTRRSVETLRLLDRSNVEVRRSYDVDFQRVAEIIDSGPNRARNSPELICLPLDITPRREFVSVDIESPWVNQCTLATRRENTRILELVLLGYLQVNGFEIDRTTDAELNQFFFFLLDPTSEEALPFLKRFVLQSRTDSAEQIHGKNSPPQSVREFETKRSVLDCLDNRMFRRFVAHFLRNYILVVCIPLDRSTLRGTIKIAIMEGNANAGIQRSPSTYIGGPFLSEWSFSLPWLNATDGSRVRIIFPSATRVLDFRVIEAVPGDTRGITVTQRASISATTNEVTLHRRHRVQRGIVRTPEEQEHAKAGRDQHYSADEHRLIAKICVSTRRAYFLIPGLALILLAFFLSCALLVISKRTPDQEISVLVALLATIPTFAAAYLLLGDEHEIISISIGASRMLLVLGVLLLLLSSVSVAMNQTYSESWLRGHAFLVKFDVLFQIALLSYFSSGVLAPSIRRATFLRRNRRSISAPKTGWLRFFWSPASTLQELAQSRFYSHSRHIEHGLFFVLLCILEFFATPLVFGEVRVFSNSVAALGWWQDLWSSLCSRVFTYFSC